MDCETENVEGRIVDRVKAIGDAIDRMGSVARRRWLGAMMNGRPVVPGSMNWLKEYKAKPERQTEPGEQER